MRRDLEIAPLTRVEGHGRIFVHFDGSEIKGVTLNFADSPRLFEALLVGKDYREVPEIICRVCSICSTVHRVASLMAVEKAFGVEVSEQTRLYRELILCGGHIQSHALHLFCLALPDHFRLPGLAALAEKAPEELIMGLRIKAAGNLIQETVGGRAIHPVTLVPGGMAKPVSRNRLTEMKAALQAVLPDTVKAFSLFLSFPPEEGKLGVPSPLAVRTDPGSSFIGSRLVAGRGFVTEADNYRDLVSERETNESNAKTALMEGCPPTVGAIARFCQGMPYSPMAQAASLEAEDRLKNADIRANSLAQTVELIHCVERSLEIIDMLAGAYFGREDSFAITPRKGTGTAAIEAPRGVLIHSYGFNGRGFCTEADIITPTSINQAAMERDLFLKARQMEGADDEEITWRLERLARAYDPCISCAVHLIKT